MRLVKILACVLLLFFGYSAKASTPAVVGYVCSYDDQKDSADIEGCVTKYVIDYVCRSAEATDCAPQNCRWIAGTGGVCDIHYKKNSYEWAGSYWTWVEIGSGVQAMTVTNTKKWVCTNGGTLDAATNTCSEPDPCLSKKGQKSGVGHYDFGTKPKVYSEGCQGGCLALWQGDDIGFTRLIGGVRHYYAIGEYINQGEKCTASDTQPDVPMSPNQKDSDGFPTEQNMAPPCKPGESSGIVNNKPVCLARDNTSGITFVTKTTHPANAVNKDGSTIDGTNANPAPGSYDDFCKTHGSLTICTGTAFDANKGTTGNASGNGTGTGSGDGSGTSGTGTGTSGTGSATSVNCPGCATESTLAAIKGLIDPKGGDGKGATDGAGKADDAYKPIQDGLLAMKDGAGPFSSLSFNFPSLFPSPGDCQKPSVSVLKQTMEIDTCYWIDLARQALGWVCYCLTVIALFRIATGGNKSESK